MDKQPNGTKKHYVKFSKKILLPVIMTTFVVSGYYIWQIRENLQQTNQTLTATEVSSGEQELSEDVQEEQTKKIVEQESIRYMLSEVDLQEWEVGTVYDEYSAMDALEALQYNMDIGDVREEYLCVDKQTIAVRNYYTMQQYWYGIPMLGYSLIMDVDGSGQVKSISGTYCDLDDFEPSVALNESDAGVAAEYYLDYTGGLKEEDYELRSEGLVIAMLDSEPKTVYQFYLIDAFTDEPYRNLLVDGNTGEVVVDNDWIFAETISDVLNKSGIS